MKQRLQLTAAEVATLVATGSKPEMIPALPENLEHLFKTFSGMTNLEGGQENTTETGNVRSFPPKITKSASSSNNKGNLTPKKPRSAPVYNYILCKNKINSEDFGEGFDYTRAAKLIIAAYSDGARLNRHREVYPVLEQQFTRSQACSLAHTLYQKGLLQEAVKE